MTQEILQKKEHLLDALRQVIASERINAEEEALYDASADRYKKYAKAKKALDTPFQLRLFTQ